MKNLKGIIIGIVLVGLCVGYFYYLVNRDISRNEDGGKVDEVQDLIQKDLVDSYPKTPREVVKIYSRMLECFYNEEYSADDFFLLADQARQLLDAELLESNTEAEHYEALRAEISQYKDKEKTIENVLVSASDTVRYRTVLDMEYASLQASYFIKEGKSYEKTYQAYLLRKDSNGKWKILYYDVVEREVEDE